MNKGITVFKFFIWGECIIRYTVGNLVLRGRVSGTLKHDLQPYI